MINTTYNHMLESSSSNTVTISYFQVMAVLWLDAKDRVLSAELPYS